MIWVIWVVDKIKVPGGVHRVDSGGVFKIWAVNLTTSQAWT